MTRGIIPARKTQGSTVSSINCDRSSLIAIFVLKRDVKLQLTAWCLWQHLRFDNYNVSQNAPTLARCNFDRNLSLSRSAVTSCGHPAKYYGNVGHLNLRGRFWPNGLNTPIKPVPEENLWNKISQILSESDSDNSFLLPNQQCQSAEENSKQWPKPANNIRSHRFVSSITFGDLFEGELSPLRWLSDAGTTIIPTALNTRF